MMAGIACEDDAGLEWHCNANRYILHLHQSPFGDELHEEPGVQNSSTSGSLPLTLQDYFMKYGDSLGFSAEKLDEEKTYEFNIRSAKNSLQTSEILSDLVQELGIIANSYAGGRPNLLYYPAKPNDIEIYAKPYQSVLSKIFRTNYIYNKKFPSPPKGGFINLTSLYENINDLLRSRLVCKYMDGPEYVSRCIEKFCQRKEVEFKKYSMASDLGYYAWHCYLKIPMQVMTAGKVEEKSISFEIQITTQLAEVITILTHGLYENSRENPKSNRDDNWRWQPRSQQFRSVYLGHSLHMLEGVIQTFRDEVLDIDLEVAAPDVAANNPIPSAKSELKSDEAPEQGSN